MSKKLFSDREIKSLLKNKYVKSVSKRGITYTDEFKILFIAEHINGVFYTSYRNQKTVKKSVITIW